MAADIAGGDGGIPGSSGDEAARRFLGSGGGMPILVLTAAARFGDKASAVR